MDIQKQESRGLIKNVATPTLIGVAFFLLFSGAKIVEPSHLDWILATQGDAIQHYIGWNFFKHSPFWQFPLGLNKGYGEAIGSSIVFSDSIPLFAFFFKAFRALLPTDFQYFGLWIALCFILQANFAWLIVARYTSDQALRTLGCALLALSPFMLFRMQGHEALVGHWLILAALYLYLREKRSVGGWFALVAIAPLVHAYLFAMVSALWIASLARQHLFEKRPLLNGVLEAASLGILVFAVLWASGYFVVPDVSAWGFGYYRLNILGPFLGNHIFSVVSPASTINGDGEGFCYPGAGIYLLTIAVAFFLFRYRHTLQLYWKRTLPLVFLCVLFYVYALSNQIAFGSHEVLSYRVPSLLDKPISSFRSSGRFVWPVVYAIEIFLIYCLLRLTNRKTALRILTICVLLQVGDQAKTVKFYHDRWSHPWRNPLVSEFWKQVPQQYKRVAFVMPLDGTDKLGPVAYLASNHGMTINGGYLARFDDRNLDQAQLELMKAIQSGDFRPDTLYIFYKDQYWNEARAHFKGNGAVGVVDSYRVIAPDWKGCSQTCGMYDDGVTLDMTDEASSAQYLPTGWSASEPDGRWTVGPVARVSIPLPSGHAPSIHVSMDFLAFVNKQHPQQRINVRIGDQNIAQWTIDKAERQVRTFDIPVAHLGANEQSLTVDFELPDAASPEELAISADTRKLAIKVKSLKITNE
jgi:hypothetical protein